MAQSITIARPYAEAAFELARESNDLAGWAQGLTLAAAVVGNEQVDLVLRSPRVSDEDKAALIIEICGDDLSPTLANMIRLLVDRDRILQLPEMARQFDDLRATHERTLDAQLVTAQPIDDAVRDRLAKALSTRLDRTVRLASEIDETLIGGAIVRAGDLIIDGSVRGRLTRLTGALSR